MTSQLMSQSGNLAPILPGGSKGDLPDLEATGGWKVSVSDRIAEEPPWDQDTFSPLDHGRPQTPAKWHIVAPMEPSIFHTHRTGSWPLEKPGGPRGLGRGLQGVAQGGLSALYLHLLSLRVGLLGWYFCLKQVQWDLLCWIHTSMELVTDVLFFWLQNVLLAWVLVLLLAWKACDGVKTLGLPLFRGLSLLNSSFWKLEHFLAQAMWAPVSCIAWVMWSFVRILEVSYEQAARMAQEEEEEEDEDQELLALFLRREDSI